MPNYCINKNAQSNGDYEVHDLTPGACAHLPEPHNQASLGYHQSCHGAVRAAKNANPGLRSRINGCYYCCEPCHTS